MNYIEIAKEIITEGYGVVAVRGTCQDEHYQVGDDCRESYEWDFEADCSTYDIDGENGMKAGGTCGIYVEISDDVGELAKELEKAIQASAEYMENGGQQAIIAGNNGVNNDRVLDAGEVRIRNAFVIAVL